MNSEPVGFWAQLAPHLVEVVSSILFLLISLALNELRKWLATKTKIGVAQSVGNFILNSAEAVVGGLEQTVVKPAKEAFADGKLSEEEYTKLLEGAKRTAVEEISKAVAGQFGTKVAGKLSGVVSHAVETAVLERSNVERLVRAAEEVPKADPTQP
jgi:predicted transcriptional regulator